MGDQGRYEKGLSHQKENAEFMVEHVTNARGMPKGRYLYTVYLTEKGNNC